MFSNIISSNTLDHENTEHRLLLFLALELFGALYFPYETSLYLAS